MDEGEAVVWFLSSDGSTPDQMVALDSADCTPLAHYTR